MADPWPDLPLDRALVSGVSAGWCPSCRRTVPVLVGRIAMKMEDVQADTLNGQPALRFDGRREPN
jgi:hypothetical protein